MISPTARALHWTVSAPIQNFQEPSRNFIWNPPLPKKLPQNLPATSRRNLCFQQPSSESLSNLPGFPLHKKRSSNFCERALPGTFAGTSGTLLRTLRETSPLPGTCPNTLKCPIPIAFRCRQLITDSLIQITKIRSCDIQNSEGSILLLSPNLIPTHLEPSLNSPCSDLCAKYIVLKRSQNLLLNVALMQFPQYLPATYI